ncbi:MAG: VWA domain-containing protein [Gemmataceae bacterium]
MRLRHKLPNVFGLYMVDVRCCSLGCVIRLWLFNDYKSNLLNRDLESKALELARLTGEQKERTRELAAARDALAKREAEAKTLAATLDERQKELEKLGGDLFALNDRLRKEKLERDTLEKDLGATRAALKSEESQNEKARATIASDTRRMAELKAELQTRLALLTARDLEMATLRVKKDELELQGKRTREQLANLETRLADAREEAGKRAREMTEAAAARDKTEKALTITTEKMDALEKMLAAADTARAKSEKSRTETERALASTMASRAKSDKALEEKARNLEELEESLAREARLRRDAETARADAEKKLQASNIELNKRKTLADSRFEGIDLTGRKVCFVVDTSGSMVLLDANTPADQKWAEVGRVLGRLMDSLPELESYQVLVFAEEPRWLFNDSGWRKYDPAKSSAEVKEALGRINPRGGTNLHQAFEKAFKLRAEGLETVYLLSDGLPNQGPGLTVTQERTLPETQRGELLGRFIRQELGEKWNQPPRPDAPRPVRIHTVGFFYESPDLGSFLWALARENRGRFVGMSSP